MIELWEDAETNHLWWAGNQTERLKRANQIAWEVARLHALLPNSELVLPEEHFSPAEMKRFHVWYREDHNSHDRYNPALAPILDSFMQKIEAKS